MMDVCVYIKFMLKVNINIYSEAVTAWGTAVEIGLLWFLACEEAPCCKHEW